VPLRVEFAKTASRAGGSGKAATSGWGAVVGPVMLVRDAEGPHHAPRQAHRSSLRWACDGDQVRCALAVPPCWGTPTHVHGIAPPPLALGTDHSAIAISAVTRPGIVLDRRSPIVRAPIRR